MNYQRANKTLHLIALPSGRQVFRWPACLSADRRSIAVGELGR